MRSCIHSCKMENLHKCIVTATTDILYLPVVRSLEKTGFLKCVGLEIFNMCLCVPFPYDQCLLQSKKCFFKGLIPSVWWNRGPTSRLLLILFVLLVLSNSRLHVMWAEWRKLCQCNLTLSSPLMPFSIMCKNWLIQSKKISKHHTNSPSILPNDAIWSHVMASMGCKGLSNSWENADEWKIKSSGWRKCFQIRRNEQGSAQFWKWSSMEKYEHFFPLSFKWKANLIFPT